MNLTIELTRLISASNKVAQKNDEMKVQRFSPSSTDAFKLALYDLKKQTKRAEDALKNKQTELFTS